MRSSIGFQLGPPHERAAGRLDDAAAVELLTTKDAIRAGQLAAEMERLNNQRRLLTSQIRGMAFDILESSPTCWISTRLSWPIPRVCGHCRQLSLQKLWKSTANPVVLLLNPPGERPGQRASTPWRVDIGASIAACAPLLIGYGGHPGAAGLSLDADKIDYFRRELS